MRNAAEDFIRIVREYRHLFTNGVVHSFTGTIEEVKELLELDLFIGINGCSLKTEQNLETLKHIPVDRILIESDAPWCDIRKSHAGFQNVNTHIKAVAKEIYSCDENEMVKSRNEPLATRQVLEVVSAVHHIPIDHAAQIIYDCSCSIFNKF